MTVGVPPMTPERRAVPEPRARVAAGVIALAVGALSSSCDVELTDPCDSTGNGQLVVVITGRGPLDGELMRVGDTLTLSASVRPITGANLNTSLGGCDVSYGDPVPASIAWSSQDTNVVRVSGTGRVTARAEGNTNAVARDLARALESAWFISVLP